MNKNGVGLNLHIAKLLINKLQGKVDVVSEKGHGTEFKFTMESESADEVKPLGIHVSLGTIKEDASAESESSGSEQVNKDEHVSAEIR